MNAGLVLFLFAFSGLALSAVAQTTIHVPSDQPTIQAGVNAAQDGDTVLVAPGTYHENVVIQAKSITLTSGATNSDQAANTIIEAPSPAAAVHIISSPHGLPPTVNLNGFTVTHTQGIQTTPTATGNGIQMEGGVSTIGGTIFTSNGVLGVISNNLILNNPGCGFATFAAQFTFEGNTVTSSSAGLCGFNQGYLSNVAGPVAISGSLSVQIIDNKIVNN